MSQREILAPQGEVGYVRGNLMFFVGFALFVAAFFFYAYITRGTPWAIPTVIVMVGAVALSSLADVKAEYGRISADRVAKVVLYTIGFNIVGGILFALGSLIWRTMQ